MQRIHTCSRAQYQSNTSHCVAKFLRALQWCYTDLSNSTIYLIMHHNGLKFCQGGIRILIYLHFHCFKKQCGHMCTINDSTYLNSINIFHFRTSNFQKVRFIKNAKMAILPQKLCQILTHQEWSRVKWWGKTSVIDLISFLSVWKTSFDPYLLIIMVHKWSGKWTYS